jgi:photosystem II stability/assembly factor-like uncharacterized protein
VHFTDARIGCAVGERNTILTTPDGGASWEPQKSGTDRTNFFSGVHFADARTGWVVGERGTILATRDGGTTWEPQTSGNANNLYRVRFIDARTGWAVGDRGTILATRDGGANWEPEKSGIATTLRSVRFADASTGWAVGDDSVVLATRDGGASWERQKSGTSKHLWSLHIADAHTSWAVGQDGTILKTRDGGAGWEPRYSGTGADLHSLYFANPHTGWAVGQRGTILATRDGGTNWEAQRSESNRDLHGVQFVDASSGWAVGDRSTVLRSKAPVYAPVIDDSRVTSEGIGELDISFRVNTDGGAAITGAQAWARIGDAQWTSLGAAKKSETRDGWWHVTWKPETIGAHSGDEIEYQAQLEDGGPPLPAVQLKKFRYDPWLQRAWRENKATVIGGLSAFAILFAYAGFLAMALLLAPARLASIGGAPALEGVAQPVGNAAFFWTLARRGFEGVTLPWLCRHPRVRRAWTALYRDGRARLDDLGKVARTSFLLEPEVLDAWVARSAPKIEAALQQLDLFKQRQIYVALPVRVGEGGALIERPSAEAFRPMFARDRTIISIVGGGGSGKSTLACALARWAIAVDPIERLTPHRILPVFIVQETTNLMEAVSQNLRRMLGDDELPDDLVRGLMAKQRLLMIIDALSEREPETRRSVEQVFSQDVPLNALVITSRTEPDFGPVDRTALYPVRLDAASIVPFIVAYLDRMKAVSQLKDGRVQVQLSERILNLAESGGRKTPVTPLLVTLFVDSALRRAVDGLSFDDMPEAVPEVFIDYLRRLNSSGTKPDMSVSHDAFIRAAQTVAAVSLGKNLVPQDFSPQSARDALSQDGASDQEDALLNRLVASGVIERRTPGGYTVLRFSLDPAAEYLAAIRQLFKMKDAGREEWQSYLSSLERTIHYSNDPEGYLTALATCYKAYKQDFSLPEILFPWEGRAHPAGAAISTDAGPPIPAT